MFLHEAKAYVLRLRLIIDKVPCDMVELHRIAHTLKGQCMFMGYQEIGYAAYELQKIFQLIMNKEKTFEENVVTIRSLIDEIETKLDKIKI
jgi:chemotaxis protein histidine kinase CheA